MFIRQGDTPIVLRVNVWFELWFPASLLPLLSHLPLPGGLHFVLQRVAFSLFGFFLWRIRMTLG